MTRLALLAILTASALCLSQSAQPTRAAPHETVYLCPGTLTRGVLVTLRSGVKRLRCKDGVYTLEQAAVGQLWDEGR